MWHSSNSTASVFMEGCALLLLAFCKCRSRVPYSTTSLYLPCVPHASVLVPSLCSLFPAIQSIRTWNGALWSLSSPSLGCPNSLQTGPHCPASTISPTQSSALTAEWMGHESIWSHSARDIQIDSRTCGQEHYSTWRSALSPIFIHFEWALGL